MSKEAHCPVCNLTLSGASEEDILQQAAQHARDSHGLEEVPAEAVEAIKASMQTV